MEVDILGCMENGLSSQKDDKLGTIVFVGIVLLIIVAAMANAIWQRWHLRSTVSNLKSLTPTVVRELRIYPRAATNKGFPIIFSTPDIIIDEFINSLSDIRTYHGNSGGILSVNHEWFLEIETIDRDVIQIECNLPANKKNVVHGELGRFEKDRRMHFGAFRSQNLFKWYQQSSHRWLREQRKDEDISIEMTR
jgi:hypothetical protein